MSRMRWTGLVSVLVLSLGAIACSAASDQPAGEETEVLAPEEQGLTLGERLNLDTGGSILVANGGPVSTVIGGFFKNSRGSCKKRPVGAFCMVTTCAEGQSASLNTNVNPGPLTVAGGGATQVLAPQPDGSYFDMVTPPVAAPWTISAPGGSFPKFEFRNVAVPKPLTAVTSPSPLQPVGTPDTERLFIDTSKDLPVEWKGGSDWVDVLLSQVEGVRVEVAPNVFALQAKTSVILDCSVPARFGRFTIPRAALSAFPKGAETPQAQRTPGAAVTHHVFGATSTAHRVAPVWAGEPALVDLVVQDNNQFGTELITFR